MALTHAKPEHRLAVVPETADATLLDLPLRTLKDIEAIERVPLHDRLKVVDFHQRVTLALEARRPDATAISFIADGDVRAPAEQISFEALRSNIGLTTTLLRDHGIGRSDVVAILLPTMPSLYWAILGTMARAIPFPLNWMLEPDPLLGLLLEANATAVIALGPTPGFKIWETLESIRDRLPSGTRIWSVSGPGGAPRPDSDLNLQLAHLAGTDVPHAPAVLAGAEDVAAYLHSGGTTGLPKIVKLSHGNISYRHWTLQLAMQIGLGEVMLQDTPVFHVGGFAGRSLPMLASGASLVIPSIMGARDKRYMANYWQFVERFGLTRLSGVPTMFSVLAKEPPQGEDLSSLRRNFMTGSTALPIAVRREFEQVSGVRILNSYGLTENTATVAFELRDSDPVEGSSGVRAPYTEVRVVALDTSEGFRICAADETGMLQVRGPGVTPGYLNPAHSAASRTPDGWLVTGDLGRIDMDGNLFVTGRAKDVIIRGGHNIDPGTIEEALLQSADVLYAAAVGKPDAYAGELPIAYVQLVPGARTTEAELIAVAAARISERPAVPKEIFILDKMPLTDIGKPIKMALRRDAAERAFRAAFSALRVPSEDVRIAIEPHPMHGSLLTISVRSAASAWAHIAADIDAIMGQYSFAYAVAWTDADGTAR